MRESCQYFKRVDVCFFYLYQHLLIHSFRFVWFQVDAVRLIAEGKAPRITQTEEGATYECIQKKDNSKVAYGSSSKHQNMSNTDDQNETSENHQILITD